MASTSATMRRLMSSSASPSAYPFSKVAIIPPPLSVPSDRLAPLREGKGLMGFLHTHLQEPRKREWLSTLFSRKHPDRIRPGSVLTVTLGHAPGVFSGVLLSIRRRGLDSSFVLRNVVQRTGVEMQIFINSPHVKDIRVVQRSGVSKANTFRKAKLFYLRDSPEKMTAIASGVSSSAEGPK